MNAMKKEKEKNQNLRQFISLRWPMETAKFSICLPLVSTHMQTDSWHWTGAYDPSSRHWGKCCPMTSTWLFLKYSSWHGPLNLGAWVVLSPLTFWHTFLVGWHMSPWPHSALTGIPKPKLKKQLSPSFNCLMQAGQHPQTLPPAWTRPSQLSISAWLALQSTEVQKFSGQTIAWAKLMETRPKMATNTKDFIFLIGFVVEN